MEGLLSFEASLLTSEERRSASAREQYIARSHGATFDTGFQVP
jgi:hypothetical protein